VALHCSAEYSVAFCGFMPGFAYLLGLPTELHLPRRSTPRTRVPAGSVAIAAEFSSVYPSASPGGWHLLGTTDLVLWDESLAAPAVLVPGMRMRFEER
jgi:KipI family sensor histidine kinase inhibitor